MHDAIGLVEDPLVRAREEIVRLPDNEMESLAMHNIPAILSETPGLIRDPAPELGVHNQEILTELGYCESDVALFAREGII